MNLYAAPMDTTCAYAAPMSPSWPEMPPWNQPAPPIKIEFTGTPDRAKLSALAIDLFTKACSRAPVGDLAVALAELLKEIEK